MKLGKLELLVTCLVAGLVLADDALARKKPGKDQSDDAPVAVAPPHCDGPRPRLAVFGFQATGKLGAFEGFNVGDALAAQLSTELERSGCFVVVDYTAMSQVMTVQEMGLAGVLDRETAPAVGQVIGAELILKGAVSEYEPNTRGRGLGIGFGDSSLPFGVRLGGQRNQAHVAMDLALVDASTGQTKFTHRVEASSKGSGFIIGLDFEKWNIGTDDFSKSPMGKATRNALAAAVTRLIEERQNLQLDWRMLVASAEGREVLLNAGSEAGLKVGDTYKVSTPIRTITDPRTGMVLRRVEREMGLVRIVSVENGLATAEPISAFEIKRGDVVHL
jgi:curli biogenesis system outer membrane secretion channel CsgG